MFNIEEKLNEFELKKLVLSKIAKGADDIIFLAIVQFTLSC